MIKDRLKELDIKITELANYLSISRPTMYKFIEMYDEGNKKELTSSICDMFDYVEQNELIDKKNVINYILKNVAVISDASSEEAGSFAKYVIDKLKSENNDNKKIIIEYLAQNDDLDDLFSYLIDASNCSSKKKKTKKDDAKAQSLKRIIGIYKNDTKENK